MFAVSSILLAQRGARTIDSTVHHTKSQSTQWHGEGRARKAGNRVQLSSTRGQGGEKNRDSREPDTLARSSSFASPSAFPPHLRGANLRPSTAAMVKRSINLGPSPSAQDTDTVTAPAPRSRAKSNRWPQRYEFTFTPNDGGGLMRSVTLVGFVLSVRKGVALSDVTVKDIPLGERTTRTKRRRRGGFSEDARTGAEFGADGPDGHAVLTYDSPQPPQQVFKARPPLAFGCPNPDAPLLRSIRQDVVNVITITDGSGLVELVVPCEEGSNGLGEERDEEVAISVSRREQDQEAAFDEEYDSDGSGCKGNVGSAHLGRSQQNGKYSNPNETSLGRLDRLQSLYTSTELAEEDQEGDDGASVGHGRDDGDGYFTKRNAQTHETLQQRERLYDSFGNEIKVHDYLYAIAYPSTELDNEHVRMAASDVEGAVHFGRQRSRTRDGWSPQSNRVRDEEGLLFTPFATLTGPRVFAAAIRVVENTTEVADHALSILVTRQRLMMPSDNANVADGGEPSYVDTYSDYHVFTY